MWLMLLVDKKNYSKNLELKGQCHSLAYVRPETGGNPNSDCISDDQTASKLKCTWRERQWADSAPLRK